MTDEIKNKGTLHCEISINNSFGNVDKKTFICLFCCRQDQHSGFSLCKISINKNKYLALENEAEIPHFCCCYDTYIIKIVHVDKIKKQIILGNYDNLYFYDLTNLEIITHIILPINYEKFIFQNINKRILYAFCPLYSRGITAYLISLKNNSIKFYDNIADYNTNQIIKSQYINKVFHLDYSQLFLFEYINNDSDLFFLLIYRIENNIFKFISKKYLINKKEIIDIQEIDKQGNILFNINIQ